MPLTVKIIVTEMNFVTIFSKSFHLIVDFLTNATNIREAMIYKKKYFHNNQNSNSPITFSIIGAMS